MHKCTIFWDEEEGEKCTDEETKTKKNVSEKKNKRLKMIVNFQQRATWYWKLLFHFISLSNERTDINVSVI